MDDKKLLQSKIFVDLYVDVHKSKLYKFILHALCILALIPCTRA